MTKNVVGFPRDPGAFKKHGFSSPRGALGLSVFGAEPIALYKIPPRRYPSADHIRDEGDDDSVEDPAGEVWPELKVSTVDGYQLFFPGSYGREQEQGDDKGQNISPVAPPDTQVEQSGDEEDLGCKCRCGPGREQQDTRIPLSDQCCACGSDGNDKES